MKSNTIVRFAALLSLLSGIVTAAPLGTAFTYQGRLSSGTNAANGSYDLKFSLYDALASSTQVGNSLTNSAASVTNGYFTVALDFGALFDGNARWLEIGVRTNGGGAFTTLIPRQPLTPAPYALYAPNAAAAGTLNGTLPAAQVTGTLSDTHLSTNVARLDATQTFTGPVQFLNPANQFAGNGTGLTNVDLVSLNSHGAINAETGWKIVDSPVVGLHPLALIAADVMGDSRLELISADSDSDQLSVLTNTPGGSFAQASAWAVGDGPQCVVAADVNGDTRLDLISADAQTNKLSVLTNTGAGGFALASTPTLAGNPQRVVAADFNKDGRQELAVGYSTHGGFLIQRYTNSLVLLTNNGSGSFGLKTGAVFTVESGSTTVLLLSSTGSVASAEVVAGDLNGDTWPDLAVVRLQSGFGGDQYLLTVLTNNRQGGFVLETSFPILIGFSSSPPAGPPLAADLNGDGALDLVYAGSGLGSALFIFTNTGGGSFALASTVSSGGAKALAVADLNGDGRPDLVRAGSVLTNGGGGTFAVWTSLPAGSGSSAVVAFAGSTYPPIVTANSGANTLSVLRPNQLLGITFNGDFNGNFTGSASGNFSGNANGYFTGSFTGDGAGLYGISVTNLAAGSGSGLDADLLDGQHASAFASASNYVAKSGDTMTGTLNVPANGLAAGGDQLVLSGGNVGIGTTSPQAALHVVGSTIVSGTLVAGTFSGNGAGLTNLIAGVAATNAWQLTGNAGTVAGVNFVGTTDDKALELKARNSRILRLEPPPSVSYQFTSPNLIGGAAVNSIDAGMKGSVISGGGATSTLFGDRPNHISANYASIGGGMDNTVTGSYAVIGGGLDNGVNADNGTVGGGETNVISSGADHSAIGGGQNNVIGTGAYQSTIGGGVYNTIQSGAAYSAIPGGGWNVVGGAHAFAAGYQARALNGGTFVWADWTEAPFQSTAANQFLIRASGGVGINTNNPQTALHVNGTARVSVLQITGGADVAEPFEMPDNDIPKGAVVIIDEENPGHLKLSERAYDTRVAGIVSGANGVNPGLTLSQQQLGEGGQNVALSGRVYVLADASNGPIKPGDLLTTSALPGHAMKVNDHNRAQGAILGKAMSGLEEGKGLVLVLVTLQ